MKKFAILALTLFTISCAMRDSFDSNPNALGDDPLNPQEPTEPQEPLTPTPEPAGGTTRIFTMLDTLWVRDTIDPEYDPATAYVWEYYNNPDLQHIYVMRVCDYDIVTHTVGAERFRIPYPGIQFTGNESKVYGNGINIGGHNFLGSGLYTTDGALIHYKGYTIDSNSLCRKDRAAMAARTGPWVDIWCGYVDAGRFDWVPEAVMTSIFYGEPHPQVYGAAFLFNFSDPENPYLENVVIHYDVWDSSQ